MLLRKMTQVVLIVTFVISTFFVFTSDSEAAIRPYDGADPMKTICYKDARTVDKKTIYLDYGSSTLELRYSARCRTIWARIINHRDPHWIAVAYIVRSFDGKRFYCTVPQYKTSCYTKQVNDRYVTSYALGSYTNDVTDEKITIVTKSY